MTHDATDAANIFCCSCMFPSVTIFRPHHIHNIDAAYCCVHCGVVCLSLFVYVMGMNPAKTAEPIEMSFSMWAQVNGTK